MINQRDTSAFSAFPTFNAGPSQVLIGQKRRHTTSLDQTKTQKTQGTQRRGCLIGKPLWTATASLKPGQLKIKFNAVSTIYKADS